MIIEAAEAEIYQVQFEEIIRGGVALLSDIKPSAWTEANVVMQKPFPGPFRYNKTPYTREIIDCLSPDHPARWIAIMKGAQVGFSSGVIYPGVCWLIKNAPGNTYITVGAPDLVEKGMEKLDIFIDNSGLRNYIMPQAKRKRNSKTGDTNYKKEFPLGYVAVLGANNHKAWRQVDLQYIFVDDFESVKGQSKESGSTRKLIEQRAAAYADTHKIFYISTPELKATSNIEPAYLLGDQRKFLVPCPCCGSFIELKWTVELENGTGTGGIYWKEKDGKLITGSVGYICQRCGEFFDDKNKHEMLNNGYWNPTATPSQEGYYSYHLSSLYAPIGMYDWAHYVNDYLEANPPGQPQNEALQKSFVNLCLGETFESTAENPQASQIMKNMRGYEPGKIPEKLSIADGNGSIVLLTCAADMNGKMKGYNGAIEDDVRLDYEIVAWSESGASYSIQHGSIGTFVPHENSKRVKEDRERWTYEWGKHNNVWTELDKIIGGLFETDTGRNMNIPVTGLDCGHYSAYAYDYLAKTNNNVIGLKGKGEDKYNKFDRNVPYFTPAKERNNLYILEVGLLKDDLSSNMLLRWNEGDEVQPVGFMNFPEATRGMYGYANYFEHYESEHRVPLYNNEGVGVAAIWRKVNSNVQNHMWDCRVYNMAVKEIIVTLTGRELKMKPFTWKDYVEVTGG